MSIIIQEVICPRCQTKEKLLEIFKKCFYCSKKYCRLCWTELQRSDDYKLLIDFIPKTNERRICSICMKSLIEQIFQNSTIKKTKTDDEYQLAIALSLSQKETDEQTKKTKKKKIEPIIIIEENLLEKTADAIQRFMNRATSNYQRKRDVIGDTALLSSFITLQTCANDLEQLKNDLDRQRQHFETLQEKLTALRDAREALNILRYEYQEKKRHEQEQRRLLMQEKIAELRQFKHNQIADFQQQYLQRLIDEEQFLKDKLAARQ